MFKNTISTYGRILKEKGKHFKRKGHLSIWHHQINKFHWPGFVVVDRRFRGQITWSVNPCKRIHWRNTPSYRDTGMKSRGTTSWTLLIIPLKLCYVYFIAQFTILYLDLWYILSRDYKIGLPYFVCLLLKTQLSEYKKKQSSDNLNQ